MKNSPNILESITILGRMLHVEGHGALKGLTAINAKLDNMDRI